LGCPLSRLGSDPHRLAPLIVRELFRQDLGQVAPLTQLGIGLRRGLEAARAATHQASASTVDPTEGVIFQCSLDLALQSTAPSALTCEH